ncbi:hypothetical protein SRRS_12150 [Sporomusa rhizae]|uniref:hypothetical protein n=1 Tax=Sporomusa rhizae TaxID=357999 RepID=UPI00352A3248
MEQTIKAYIRKERLRYFGRGVAWLMLALIGFFGSLGTLYEVLDGKIRFSAMDIGITTLLVLMCIGGGWRAALSFYRAFFSESGKLTQSVLSQRTDRKQKAEELFAEIDADLAQNVVAFGKLRVGSVWVMGDEAMRLDRVCGIFRETIFLVGSSPRSIYHLYLMDQDNNLQCNLMTYESDLDDAADYLSGRLPNAFVGDITDLPLLVSKNEQELLACLSEVQPPTRAMAAASAQPFNFISVDGVPTSNFTWDDVQKALYALREGESAGLEFLSPIEIPEGKAKLLLCRAEERSRMKLLLLCTKQDGSQHWCARANVEHKEAAALLKACFSYGELSFDGFTEERGR